MRLDLAEETILALLEVSPPRVAQQQGRRVKLGPFGEQTRSLIERSTVALLQPYLSGRLLEQLLPPGFTLSQ